MEEILGNPMPTVEKIFHFFPRGYHEFMVRGSFFALILIIWHVFCFFIDLKV